MTRMSTNQRMDHQKAVCPYNGVLLSNEKECSTNTVYNTAKPWKWYSKWKKPVTTHHLLCDSTYVEWPEQENLYRQKVD